MRWIAYAVSRKCALRRVSDEVLLVPEITALPRKYTLQKDLSHELCNDLQTISTHIIQEVLFFKKKVTSEYLNKIKLELSYFY